MRRTGHLSGVLSGVVAVCLSLSGCGPQPLPSLEGSEGDEGSAGTSVDATGTTSNLEGNGESGTQDADDEAPPPDLGDPDEAPLGQTCYSFASDSPDGPEIVWQRLEPGLGAWWGVTVGPDGSVYASGEGERQLAAYDGSGHERWAIGEPTDAARAIVWSGDRLVVGGTSIYTPEDHPDWLRVYSSEGELLDELLDELGDNAFWNLAGSPSGEILAGGRHWGSSEELRVALYEPDLGLRWTFTTGDLEAASGGSSLPEVAFDDQGRAYASFRFQPPETRQIVRFDANGEVEWSVDLVDEEPAFEAWPASLAIGERVYAGGVVFQGGQADDRSWVGGFAADGAVVWTSTFDGDPWDSVSALVPIAGGVLAGGDLSTGSRDAWVAALTDAGEVTWSMTADGQAGGQDRVHALARAADGDVVVVGTVECSVGGEQPFIARLRP